MEDMLTDLGLGSAPWGEKIIKRVHKKIIEEGKVMWRDDVITYIQEEMMLLS